ncbi:transposase [Streptomyces avermitilis]
MGRGDLTDAEGERQRAFLPVGNGRCGRSRDQRQVIDRIPHRIRVGVQWRDLPERCGPWKTEGGTRMRTARVVRISARVRWRAGHRRWISADVCSAPSTQTQTQHPAPSTRQR